MGVILSYIRSFVFDREDGGFSAAALVMLPVFFMLMGAPMNMINLLRNKEQYQGFADALAYTALHEAYNEDQTLEQAKSATIQKSQNLKSSRELSVALPASNIQYGVWDEETRTFSEDDNSRKAVRVELDFLETNGNPIQDLVRPFFGKKYSDLKAVSYASTYRPNCFRNGLIALGELVLKDGTNVGEGVCVHGQAGVTVGNGGTFAQGAEVAVLTKAHLNANYAANPGLEDALEIGRKHIALLSQVDLVYDDLFSASRSDFTPSYIVDETIIGLGPRVVQPNDFVSGRIHFNRCNNNRRMKFERGVYRDFVLISPNCAFTFAGGVSLENVMIVTENGWDRSFFSFNRLSLGNQDDCGAGKGAVLMANGGGYFSAGLFAVGSQIITNKLLFIESGDNKRNVLRGSSLLSGGSLVLGDNNDISSCNNDGSNEILEVDYFRLVQ